MKSQAHFLNSAEQILSTHNTKKTLRNKRQLILKTTISAFSPNFSFDWSSDVTLLNIMNFQFIRSAVRSVLLKTNIIAVVYQSFAISRASQYDSLSHAFQLT